MENNKEIWRSVDGYDGIYDASSTGRVRSLKFNKSKVLKNTLSKSGYLKVVLCNSLGQKTISVHQLVAMGFLSHTPNGHKVVVDHIDNNKLNNNVSNLQLITSRGNISKDQKGSSRYTGVHWHKASMKWVAQIEINGKKNHLGLFTSELDASNAYKNKLKSIL